MAKVALFACIVTIFAVSASSAATVPSTKAYVELFTETIKNSYLHPFLKDYVQRKIREGMDRMPAHVAEMLMRGPSKEAKEKIENALAMGSKAENNLPTV
jgi:hypothetical protein